MKAVVNDILNTWTLRRFIMVVSASSFGMIAALKLFHRV